MYIKKFRFLNKNKTKVQLSYVDNVYDKELIEVQIDCTLKDLFNSMINTEWLFCNRCNNGFYNAVQKRIIKNKETMNIDENYDNFIYLYNKFKLNKIQTKYV